MRSVVAQTANRVELGKQSTVEQVLFFEPDQTVELCGLVVAKLEMIQ